MDHHSNTNEGQRILRNQKKTKLHLLVDGQKDQPNQNTQPKTPNYNVEELQKYLIPNSNRRPILPIPVVMKEQASEEEKYERLLKEFIRKIEMRDISVEECFESLIECNI